MKQLILSFVLILMTNSLQAQLVIPDSDVEESYGTRVNVSGQILKGVMVLSTSSSRTGLHVIFPEKGSLTEDQLCITIQSIDGTYRANINHPLNSSISGPVSVSFSTQYQEVLESLKDVELAVTAYLKNECSGASEYLLASWVDAPFQSHGVRLLINSSARNNQVLVRREVGENTVVRCDPISLPGSVAYNTVCDIEGNNAGKVSQMRVVRSTGGSQFRPLDLIISN